MRTRLVTWGTNGKDEKVLIGISLKADENKIELVAVPANDCTEDFYNLMMNKWREGADIDLPASTEKSTLELTMSESILPADYRVEKSDIIQRAQMEWHFLVLSTKLYRNFKSDLEEMSEKVKRLETYDKSLWDDLKGLWDNIQKHTFDRNIIRDHADSLREKSNALFEELKKLRSSVEQSLVAKSSAILDVFNTKVDEIHKRINSGGVLKIIFDDLKNIQEEYRNQILVREDKNKIFKKLDEAFNAIREKRNGGSTNSSSRPSNQSNGALDRFDVRLQGIEQALKKLEKSIEYDEKDIQSENNRIATSTGQLEAQIRVAKIKMIEDRIKSKKEKFDELQQIKISLNKSFESLKKNEEKRIKKQEENEHRKVEEQKVKAKYDDELNNKPALNAEVENKLLKAAEEIKSSKKPRLKKPEIILEETIIPTDSNTENFSENLIKGNSDDEANISNSESLNSAISDNNDNQPDSASDSSELKKS
ncbi:MAG: hypothetical protein ABIO44_14405 [Saprospiraceae bacterium]